MPHCGCHCWLAQQCNILLYSRHGAIAPASEENSPFRPAQPLSRTDLFLFQASAAVIRPRATRDALREYRSCYTGPWICIDCLRLHAGTCPLVGLSGSRIIGHCRSAQGHQETFFLPGQTITHRASQPSIEPIDGPAATGSHGISLLARGPGVRQESGYYGGCFSSRRIHPFQSGKAAPGGE